MPDSMDRQYEACDEISLWSIAALLVRTRRWMIGTAFVVVLAIAIWGLPQPRSWTAEVSFRPQGGQSSTGQLTALAAQFGFSAGSASDADSPEFYAGLVRSRALVLRIAQNPVPGPNGSIFLSELVGITGSSDELVTERTVQWLQNEVLSVSTTRETGIVTVSARTLRPEVSKALVERVIEELNLFNNALRRTQASAEREHVEEQVAVAREELMTAEARLLVFLESNRQFGNSPELRFEHDRLQREVGMRQQLYTSLNQAFQQARILEVRNTPVINVIQSPSLPVIPDRRGLALRLVLGLLLGAGVGFALGLIRNLKAPEDEADQEAWTEVVGFADDLRHMRLRRIFFGPS